MRVFLSWSGNRSRYVAEQFSEWLPVVIQSVDTFMSQHDVDAGSRWAREIDDHLEATDFGILFVTPENQEEPWLLHEAGALGKSVEESRVVPVTIEMEPADVGWPLARFQGVNLEEDGVRKLVDSINGALEEDQLEPSVLGRAFDTNWPILREDLEDIPPRPEDATTVEDTPEEAQRRRDEKLDEVLELVRSISRQRTIGDLTGKYLGRNIDPGIKKSQMESRYVLKGNPEKVDLAFREEFSHAITSIAGKVEQSRIENGEEGTREYELIVKHDANEGDLDEVVAEAADAAEVEVLSVTHRPLT